MTISQNSKTSLTSAQMNERRQFDGLYFSLNEIKKMSEGIETILDNSKHLIQPKVYNNISSLIGTLEADYDTIVNPIEDENPIEDVKQEVTKHHVQLVIETPEPMNSKDVGYEVVEFLSNGMESAECDWIVGATDLYPIGIPHGDQEEVVNWKLHADYIAFEKRCEEAIQQTIDEGKKRLNEGKDSTEN